VEHDGDDLVAGNLADGEISPVKTPPPFSVTSKWGRLTRKPHLSISLCSRRCTAPGVPNDFSGRFLTGIFEMISRKYENAPKNFISLICAPNLLKQILFGPK
jgi:hypothetical protein